MFSKRHISKVVLLLLFAFFLVPHVSMAASLYLSPAEKTYSAGDTFRVSVMLSTPQDSANAMSGEIRFPAEKLQLVSFSKGSIVNLWPEEPVISNTNGTFSFSGIILNPGFRGEAAQIGVLTFRAKTAADTQVVFTSGSVLANDGTGTNILNSLRNGSYLIVPAKSEVNTSPKPHNITPAISTTSTTTIPVLAPIPILVEEEFPMAWGKAFINLLSFYISGFALILLLIFLAESLKKYIRSKRLHVDQKVYGLEVATYKKLTRIKKVIEKEIKEVEEVRDMHAHSKKENHIIDTLYDSLDKIREDLRHIKKP